MTLRDGLLVGHRDGQAYRVFAPPWWRVDLWAWWVWCSCAAVLVRWRPWRRRAERQDAARTFGRVAVTWRDGDVQRTELVCVVAVKPSRGKR